MDSRTCHRVGGRQQRVTGVDSRTCHMVGSRQQRVTGVDSKDMSHGWG